MLKLWLLGLGLMLKLGGEEFDAVIPGHALTTAPWLEEMRVRQAYLHVLLSGTHGGIIKNDGLQQ